MRHRIQDKKFNRDANQRKALFMGLLRNLAEQGSIVTTMARAKAVKRLADRMITTAKGNDLAARRTLHMFFGKRDVVNKLVDVIAPAMTDRTSGFVRVIDMGSRRGDNTPMARLEFTTQAGVRGSFKSEKPKTEKVKAVRVAKAAATKNEVVAEKKVEAEIKETKVAKAAEPKKKAKKEVAQ